MEQVGTTFEMLSKYVPSLIGAIAVLVVGWVVAAFVARGVRAGLQKTGASKQMAGWFGNVDTDREAVEIWIGRATFTILFLFVLVGFFQVLGLSEISGPIIGFLNEVFVYLPRLIAPMILVVVAWVLAKILKAVVFRTLTAAKLDEKLASEAELETETATPVAQAMSDAAYWLTFLLFLPAILSALRLGGLLEPVRGMVDEVLAFLPNLLAAGVLLVVGWIVARIVRRIVTNVLVAIGADRLSEQIGLKNAIGDQKLSSLIGLIVYILVLVPVIVAGLNALELEAVTSPASGMLSTFLNALPKVFAAILVLSIAFIVGQIIAGLAKNLLHGIGLDRLLGKMGVEATPTAEQELRLSSIAGQFILVAIMLFAAVEALRLVEFDAVAQLGTQFLVFASKILLGLAIIGLGLYLANIAASAIQAMKLQQAALLALAARSAIVILAVAVGVSQMGLGTEIVALAFGILFGALALALALAFGLGSRETAGRLFDGWVNSLEAKSGRRSRRTPVKSQD